MDPQLSRFMNQLLTHGGELRVIEGPKFDETFNEHAASRARSLGLVRLTTDGGFGVEVGYKLTRKGWQAVGVEPPKTLFGHLWGMIRQAA